MVAILSLALMPLGLIALLASLQAAQSADARRQSELRVAATESTRKLASELASDLVTMHEAVRAVEADLGMATPCARADAVLHARQSRTVKFALFGPGSTPLCVVDGLDTPRPATVFEGTAPTFRRTGEALDIIVPSPSGTSVAVARYPAAMLAKLAHPSGYGVPFVQTLDFGGTSLQLTGELPASNLSRAATQTLPLGVGDLALTMAIASTPFGATEALLTFLPLLMWASAAIVGFSVVEGLLIRPLRALRVAVASYVPGSSTRLALPTTPAIELRALGDSFTAFADRLSQREQELESALDNQVRLTREVHHRVKNNLQVIASLISLHARGTTSNDVRAAYVAIQRRVDALAVVHRNHFAELEHAQGIDLKQLLGELAANFRASVTHGHGAPAITVAAEPLYVTQDTAMPLAFLFTEIAEMALNGGTAVPIVVSARAKPDGTAGTLCIGSEAFHDALAPTAVASKRIIEGFARQLRAPLIHDAEAGSYSIDFAVLKKMSES